MTKIDNSIYILFHRKNLYYIKINPWKNVQFLPLRKLGFFKLNTCYKYKLNNEYIYT